MSKHSEKKIKLEKNNNNCMLYIVYSNSFLLKIS